MKPLLVKQHLLGRATSVRTDILMHSLGGVAEIGGDLSFRSQLGDTELFHCCQTCFFFCSHYPVIDVLSVTRHMVSHYVYSHISTQHRASMLLLLELLSVRDCVLSCPLSSADDIDMFVHFICIS